jgi:hypothetical protein
MEIKKLLSKPSTAIVLIVAGPALTVLWISMMQPSEPEISHTALQKTIIYLAVTSIVISFIAHAILSFEKGLIWSGVISEVIYQNIFVIFALNRSNWEEYFMWLPIMMISVAAITLPMLLSAAYGCGVIVKAFRSR